MTRPRVSPESCAKPVPVVDTNLLRNAIVRDRAFPRAKMSGGPTSHQPIVPSDCGSRMRTESGASIPAGHTAVMARRREPPGALDFFCTPPWATRALFRHVLPALGVEAIGSAWEPACGEGHMAAVIEEFARGPVVASDTFDGYGYGRAPVDFLHDAPLARPDWIITNPPFNLACEFTLHALTRQRRRGDVGSRAMGRRR